MSVIWIKYGVHQNLASLSQKQPIKMTRGDLDKIHIVGRSARLLQEYPVKLSKISKYLQWK